MVYEYASKIGMICIVGSIVFHLVAGLLPMQPNLREELRDCTREMGHTGVLFMFLAWIFGVQVGFYEDCAMMLQRFSYWFILVFMALVIGCAILNRNRTTEERSIARSLKHSALGYGITCFIMAVLLG